MGPKFAILESLIRRKKFYQIHRDDIEGVKLLATPYPTLSNIQEFDANNGHIIKSTYNEVMEALGLKRPCLGVSKVIMFDEILRVERRQGVKTRLKASSVMPRNKSSKGVSSPKVDGVLCLTQGALDDLSILFEEVAQCVWVPVNEVDSRTYLEPPSRVFMQAAENTAFPSRLNRWTRIKCHRQIYEALRHSDLFSTLSQTARNRTNAHCESFVASCNAVGTRSCGC